jgi:peptidyl-tRNA hydrolase, PTH1 family
VSHIAIVGLGNPGEEYQNTRHNAGFDVIDNIALHHHFPVFSNKFSSFVSSKNILSCKVTLVKPQTYMNLSGNAVTKIIQFYKIPLENLIVIHDDLDLPLAKIKAKFAGGSGGHNGIKSIDQHLGASYYRLKIGIGKSNNQQDVSNFVLGKMSSQENKIIKLLGEIIACNLNLILDKDMSMFMNKITMECKKYGL